MKVWCADVLDVGCGINAARGGGVFRNVAEIVDEDVDFVEEIGEALCISNVTFTSFSRN